MQADPFPKAPGSGAEAELARLRAHLGLALEAGRMGTWEWNIATGVVEWSPQEERLYGLEPGTFAGTVEAYRALIHPDDVPHAWRVVEEALQRQADSHHVLHRIIRPDGEIRWLESHGRFVYNPDGAPDRLVGISTDVTDRMRYDRLRLRQDEMLGAVNVGLWYCDLPFSALNWDRKVKEHFWLPPEAHVTIDTFYDRLHPDDRERTRTAIEHSIATRAPYDIEYRTVAPEGMPEAGQIRWIRAIGYTGYDTAGQPIRFDGVTVDVSETRLTAERLVASEQRYEYASRATSNAIWDWNLQTDQVAWNPGVQTVFGYAEGEVEETAEWWYLHIHRDDRERVVTGIHTVIDDPDGPSAWSDEYRFRNVDGSHALVIDRGYVARDESGRAIRMIGAMEDVTARRGAEAARDAALTEAHFERARLQEIFAQSPSAIAVSEGPEHRMVVTNAAYQEVVGGREVVGRTLREAFPELIDQGFFELLDEVYRTGEPYVGTEVPVRLDRDGDGLTEEYYFNFTYQPLRALDGLISGVLTHAVEITPQVQARAEVERKAEELAHLAGALERSNAELDQFAYVTSHDLKAPLRGIANLAQWIEEDLGDKVDGESLEHMRLLKGRVHRMEALIDGILTFSRAARQRERPEPVDTGALVTEVVDLLAPPVGIVRVETEMPTRNTERIPLQQVLMNLINNALRHGAQENPEVRVGCRVGGSEDEFYVADNGPGIAAEYQDRIWGIFQTLQARDKVEGTGIGLAVVKKVVESRGGRVWVESKEGQGATFRFTWPRSAGQQTLTDGPEDQDA